jgi:hypothetical protein
VGVQATSAEQAVPCIQGESSVTTNTNPLWMLVPWAVFAIGAGLKFWRLTTLFRRHLLGTPTRTERFRQALERIWQKNQQAA